MGTHTLDDSNLVPDIHGLESNQKNSRKYRHKIANAFGYTRHQEIIMTDKLHLSGGSSLVCVSNGNTTDISCIVTTYSYRLMETELRIVSILVVSYGTLITQFTQFKSLK